MMHLVHEGGDDEPAQDAVAPRPHGDVGMVELHHGKHHKAYVDNLNTALANEKPQTLIDILKATKKYPAGVRNNAGGHWNHSFFWTLMENEKAGSKMSDGLKVEIEKAFGSVEKFKEQFEAKALSQFGSGWVWLIKDRTGKLLIVTTPNQDNPLMDIATQPGRPILALDVWEHAYYLNYQNRRAEYAKNFWRVVNWRQVSDYFSEK